MSTPKPLSDWHLHCARHTLLRSGVIAYPTEAVWGLGCDPWDSSAVERILELKQRPMHKGLILVAACVDQIRFLLDPLPEELQISAHPVVRALCTAAGMPLVSTSCNPSGHPPARHPWQVHRYFGDRLDRIVPGAVGGDRNPSRIIDIVTGKQLR